MFAAISLAIRRWRFRPLHAASIILILGVGIGAATAVFSVVDQTVLRRPPFAHADRLMEGMGYHRPGGGGGNILTPQAILGWQAQRALFEAFEGFAPRQLDVTSEQGEPERVVALQVSTGLFRMLGVQPVLGRDFIEGDGRPGGERTVIISDRIWRRHFAQRPDVIGAALSLNEEKHTVVGVMPRRFRLMGDSDLVWLPVDVQAHAGNAAMRSFYGLGRLATSVRRGTEQQLADTIADRLQAESPLPMTWGLRVQPKKVAYVYDTTRTALFVLLGAVGFVLLITCANTAHLFLSQVAARQREIAVRTALGAERRRLIADVLVESVLLAVCGGAFGLLMAIWMLDGITAALPPNLVFSSTTPIEIDPRILGVSGLLTLVTGLAFGAIPAIRGSRPDVTVTLKTGSTAGSTATSHRRLSAALVASEVAFSLILLVGSALMIRTLTNLHAISPGFAPDGVVAVTVSLPSDKYPDGASRTAFVRTLQDKLRAIPGVSETAVAQGVPPDSGGIHFGTPEAEGSPLPGANAAEARIPFENVSADYFRTLRIPLVAGRTFTEADSAESTIISKALADRYWPAGDAIGRRFRPHGSASWTTIVGVAGNVEGRGFEDRTLLRMYYPWDSRPATTPPSPGPRPRTYATRVILARAVDPDALLPAIRPAVWSMDKNQPVERIALARDLYAEAFARQRFVLQLMIAFGALAALLTAAGLFAVLSQLVARRTREIGLRVALGARSADVLRLVISRGVGLTFAGTIVGLGVAAALTRFLRALLFGVEPIDPLSLTAAALAMFAIALLACWLPARRAARIDPAMALRIE